MGGRSLSEEVKMWLPLIIFSVIGLELAIHGFGQDPMAVFTIYTVICVVLCVVSLCCGKYFNYAFFPVSVLTQRRLDGNCAVVTGANSGSGYETAKELVRRGCDVIITCRSQAKAETAIASILKELKEEGFDPSMYGELDYAIMELSSKKSVDSAIQAIVSKSQKPSKKRGKKSSADDSQSKAQSAWEVNILVNNAGAWTQNAAITEDGIESQWQCNYLAPFYLTKQLLPTLKRHSSARGYGRIVNVASIGHMFATVEVFDAFLSDDTRGDIRYWETKQSQNVYGDTKCAQMLHARKLQHLLDEERDDAHGGRSVGSYLYAVSVHPGYINSGFMQLDTRPLVVRLMFSVVYPFMATFAMISPKQGAQTSLHCVLANKDVKAGGYHANCRPSGTMKSGRAVLSTKMDPLYEASDKIWN